MQNPLTLQLASLVVALAVVLSACDDGESTGPDDHCTHPSHRSNP